MELQLTTGIDEAGRGPLAGPVMAAAVILDPHQPIIGLADSKKLSEAKRESLFVQIIKQSLAYGIGRADVAEIDKLNILQATMLAMERAAAALDPKPSRALVDGNRAPKLNCEVKTIIKGDQTVACIQAASILAKVTRDHEMLELDKKYPGYGFAQHKGYGTKQHLDALHKLGACDIHRRSFKPVAQMFLASID